MKKEELEKGENLVHEFITGMVDFVEKKKQEYIEQMISSMVVQADIISRARKDGIEISEIMPEIKKKYEEFIIKSKI